MYGIAIMKISKIGQRIKKLGYRLVDAKIFDGQSANKRSTKPAVILVRQKNGKPASMSTLSSIAALIKKSHAVDVVFDVNDSSDEASSLQNTKNPLETSVPSAGLQSPAYRSAADQNQGFLLQAITSQALMEAVLGQMSIGVFLINRSGDILFYNSIADRILSENRLWSRTVADIKREEEAARAKADAEEKVEAEADVIKDDDCEGKEKPDLLLSHPLVRDILDGLKKKKCRFPVFTDKESAPLPEYLSYRGLDQLIVCPIDNGEDTVAAAVFIYDFGYQHRDLTSALCTYHDLSLGEARVAATLLRTTDTQAIADELFISVETVRSYIKILFDKTGKNSRPQLIKMLAGGAVGSLLP